MRTSADPVQHNLKLDHRGEYRQDDQDHVNLMHCQKEVNLFGQFGQLLCFVIHSNFPSGLGLRLRCTFMPAIVGPLDD